MCNAFWPFSSNRPSSMLSDAELRRLARRGCLCCPFSASRCQRLSNNCDLHLFARGDIVQMRRSGGMSCGSRHWVPVRASSRLGIGSACAVPYGWDDFFD